MNQRAGNDAAAEAHAGPRDLGDWLAIGFGAGLVPVAPGTWGTLAGVALYLLLEPLPWPAYAAITAAAFGFGVWLCGRAARRLGRHDHRSIVWDEIVGYLVTMIAAPSGWPWVVGGFALFRLFDIVKPWPIRLVDRRVGGGLGVMLDDLLAAVFAAGSLELLVLLSKHV